MTQTLPYNFGALSPELSGWDRSKIAVLPIPYDATSTQPGSRHGPAALIAASRRMELFDEELLVDISASVGICTLEELEPDMRGPEHMVTRCTDAARAVVQSNKFLFSVGGEGTVSLGPIKALAERYPAMSVLHIDAHLDLRSQFHGTAVHHQCVMHHVSNVMNVHVVNVGARSFSEEEYRHADAKGLRPFYARDVVGRYDFVDRLLDELHDEVYVCFDLSALDPSVVPATARPEPGGLDWYLTTHILRRVGEKRRIVGADIHELLPIPGQTASDALAAKLAYKIMGYAFLLR
ncbi:MAG: agmatinase [Myxococcota bacterium]